MQGCWHDAKQWTMAYQEFETKNKGAEQKGKSGFGVGLKHALFTVKRTGAQFFLRKRDFPLDLQTFVHYNVISKLWP